MVNDCALPVPGLADKDGLGTDGIEDASTHGALMSSWLFLWERCIIMRGIKEKCGKRGGIYEENSDDLLCQ